MKKEEKMGRGTRDKAGVRGQGSGVSSNVCEHYMLTTRLDSEQKTDPRSPIPDPLSLFLLFLLISCSSIPNVNITDNSNSLLLDSGAEVYIIADVKKAQPILNILPIKELNEKRTAQMLEKTDTFAAAFFSEKDERHFQIYARGNYPSVGAGMALGGNKNWKKHKAEAGYKYWYNEANGLSLALNSKTAFVVSSQGEACPPVPAQAGIPMPEGFAGFSANAPVSGWLADPAPLISRIISETGLPIRFPVIGLFINFYPLLCCELADTENSGQDNHLEAVIRFQFENASVARGIVTILNLAIGYIPEELSIAALFFANPPIQNDRYVDIKTAPLNEKDIGLLLRLLF